MVYLISMKILTFFKFFVLFFHKISFVRAITSSVGANAIFGVIKRSMAFIHGFKGSINNKIKKDRAI